MPKRRADWVNRADSEDADHAGGGAGILAVRSSMKGA